MLCIYLTPDFLFIFDLFFPLTCPFLLSSAPNLSLLVGIFPITNLFISRPFPCRLSTTCCHLLVYRSCTRCEITHGFIDLLYDRCPITDVTCFFFPFLILPTFLLYLWRSPGITFLIPDLGGDFSFSCIDLRCGVFSSFRVVAI